MSIIYNYIKKLAVLFKESASLIDQTLESAKINVEISSVAILILVALTMTHS